MKIMRGGDLSLSSAQWFFLVTVVSLLAHHLSTSSLESFIYVGCTQLKYNPGTPYESNIDSVLASLVNSASMSNCNNFKISLPGSTQSDVVYGLFQCRRNLSSCDCHHCVANAVSRLGDFCIGTSGGTLQLEGCFIIYDNTSFLGAQDKSVVSKKCGHYGYDSELLTRRDAVLAYLTGGGGQYFRGARSGEVQGMVQCLQDLSMGECQDCPSEAIQRLKTECGASRWGDMFLSKCYERYSDRDSVTCRSIRLSKRADCEMAAYAAVVSVKILLEKYVKYCDIVFNPLSLEFIEFAYKEVKSFRERINASLGQSAEAIHKFEDVFKNKWETEIHTLPEVDIEDPTRPKLYSTKVL